MIEIVTTDHRETFKSATVTGSRNLSSNDVGERESGVGKQLVWLQCSASMLCRQCIEARQNGGNCFHKTKRYFCFLEGIQQFVSKIKNRLKKGVDY